MIDFWHAWCVNIFWQIDEGRDGGRVEGRDRGRVEGVKTTTKRRLKFPVRSKKNGLKDFVRKSHF